MITHGWSGRWRACAPAYTVGTPFLVASAGLPAVVASGALPRSPQPSGTVLSGEDRSFSNTWSYSAPTGAGGHNHDSDDDDEEEEEEGGGPMKAAVLNEQPGSLVIEDLHIDDP